MYFLPALSHFIMIFSFTPDSNKDFLILSR